MAGSVANIAIKLVANSIGLSSGLSSAEKRIAKFNSQAKSLGRDAASSFGGVASALTGIGVGLSAGGLAAGLKSAISRLDELGDKAAGLGETAAALEELGYIGTRSGSSPEAVALGLDKMTKSIGDAASKGGDSAKIFNALGLDLEQLTQETPTQAFYDVAQAISELPTVYDRAAAASAIFGKGAKDMMGVFNDPNAIADYAADFDSLHGDVQKAANTASDAQDQFDRLEQALMGVGENAVIAFGPVVTSAIKGFTDQLGELNNNQQAMDTMLTFVDGIGAASQAAAPLIGMLTEKLAATATLIKTVAGYSLSVGELLFGPLYKTSTGTGAINQKKLGKHLLRGDIPGLQGLVDGTKGPQISAGLSMVGEANGSISTTNIRGGGASSAAASAATKAQQAQTLADLYAQQDAFDEQQKEIEDSDKKLQDYAKRLTESVQTPMEKYEQKIKDINDALAKNVISTETARRASQAAWNDMAGAKGAKQPAGYALTDWGQQMMDYNVPRGGFVGGNVPANFRMFTDPVTSAMQGGRTSMSMQDFAAQAYQPVDENGDWLQSIADNTKRIADNTAQMGMVA